MTKYLVFEIPEFIAEEDTRILLKIHNSEDIQCPDYYFFEGDVKDDWLRFPDEIKLKKTRKQKKLERKIARDKYKETDEYKEKQRERLEDPENIEKRTKYQQQPHIMERKRKLGERQRKVSKRLKLIDPEFYTEIIEELNVELGL